MSSNVSRKEQRIQAACQATINGDFTDATQAAHANNVAPSTVRHRLLGRPGKSETQAGTPRLNLQQEQHLAQWVRDLQTQLIPPAHTTIRDMADELLSLRGTNESVGDKWTSRFVCRHSLNTERSRPKDFSRLTSLTDEIILQLFSVFKFIVEAYQIAHINIYNMDEKGFQIGQIGKSLVVFNKRNGPPVSVSTGTSKWVSIIECVGMEGDLISPFVIHMGKEIQDS